MKKRHTPGGNFFFLRYGGAGWDFRQDVGEDRTTGRLFFFCGGERGDPARTPRQTLGGGEDDTKKKKNVGGLFAGLGEKTRIWGGGGECERRGNESVGRFLGRKGFVLVVEELEYSLDYVSDFERWTGVSGITLDGCMSVLGEEGRGVGTGEWIFWGSISPPGEKTFDGLYAHHFYTLEK